MAEINTGSKVLCVAETPFHLMALLALVTQYPNIQFDLIVNNQFSGADYYTDRIRAIGLFNSIICTDRPYPTSNHLGMDTVKSSLFADKEYIKRCEMCLQGISNSNYDYLLCASYTVLTTDIHRYYRFTYGTFFYDDGLGSHNGNLFKCFACFDDILNYKYVSLTKTELTKRLSKKVLVIILGKKLQFDIKGIFLFNPSKIDTLLYSSINVYPISIDDGLEYIDSVFLSGYEQLLEKYSNYKAFFLSLPDEVSSQEKITESEILSSIISQTDIDIGVRLHPRRLIDDFTSVQSNILSNSVSWEALLARGCINEESVIIGTCSSAQIHPKTLFNLEPTLIFLNHLLPDGFLSRSSYNESINQLRDLYCDRSRVFAPESINCLIDILNSLNQGYRNE